MTVSRLRPYATTVFAEMSALAARVGAVNLGQGFPDEDGPPAMLKAARDAIAEGVNQYPPGIGIPALREAVAAQRKRNFGIDYDPATEVLVTVGATEAIAAAVLGLVEPGSEVVLVQPFYDSYSPVVAMAGAQRVITDEVYEHLVFDDRRHIPLAGFDGMAERTVTISSAAKMFNCTGWKIGWACGPAELILGVRAAKQYLSYVGGAPFQPAVADALNTEEAWVAALRTSLQDRRDRLARGLTEVGFRVHDSAGTYFLCADPRPLGYTDSTAFCAALPEQVGVAAIPLTAFCDPAAKDWIEWNHLVRFTFCKRDDTLDEAIRRLARLRDGPAMSIDLNERHP
jgi:N-succinyldiaminopimelate aminotransferase